MYMFVGWPSVRHFKGDADMYIKTDGNNYITIVSWGGVLIGGIEVEDFEFAEDIRAYKLVDGEIVLGEIRLAELQKEQSTQAELHELQKVLTETDAIALQWWEENELVVEHEITEDEFKTTMQKRQNARKRIRELKEATNNGSSTSN